VLKYFLYALYLTNSSIYVGFEILTAVTIKITILWGVRPCSLVEFHRHFRATHSLHLEGRRASQARSRRQADALSPSLSLSLSRLLPPASCLANSSILTIEAVCPSETSVDFYQTTGCYIPDNSTLSKLIMCKFYAFLLGKLNRKAENASEKEEILMNTWIVR
jgi:hypothetical protein